MEEVDRADHVDLRVVVGPRDGNADVRLGREVEADLRLQPGEELVLRLTNVALDQLHSLGQVLPLAGGEVVEDHHVFTAGDEPLGDVRADETRSSGNQDGHARILGADLAAPTRKAGAGFAGAGD